LAEADERQAVIDANVEAHVALADEYRQRTRQVATDRSLWKGWYHDHLRLAIGELKAAHPDGPIRALDALGGSGKTALFLQQHGVEVVLNDVSPDMTRIYEEIAGELGLSAKVVLGDIEGYLERPDVDRFHLVTASSALHHVLDYRALLRTLYEHLEPGGFVHTAWDPLPRSSTARALGKAEYYVSLLRRPRALLRGARQRVDRARGGGVVDHEFHKSIDDDALVRDVQAMGFVVREHHRNASGSLAVTRPLWRRLRAYNTFALLLQKPPDAS
jgi:SAM-dependent methyltransferase